MKRGLAVAAMPAVLSGAALAYPLLLSSGYVLAAWGVYQFFAPVCHQDAARSFWIAGVPLPVCARCLGIYIGATVGAFFSLQRRTARIAVAGLLAQNLAEWAGEVAGLHGLWMAPRFVLGAALGAAIGALVTSGSVEK